MDKHTSKSSIAKVLKERRPLNTARESEEKGPNKSVKPVDGNILSFKYALLGKTGIKMNIDAVADKGRILKPLPQLRKEGGNIVVQLDVDEYQRGGS